MKEEKHGRGVEQAWKMLDLFAGLGVHSFGLTRTDLDGYKCDYRAAQNLEVLRRGIPSLLGTAIERRQNLIVRPKGAKAELVQLDDLDGSGLERARSAAFLILVTSPGNHQAWMAVRGCGPDLARRLRQASGADPSASGATRLAGSVNFKRRYAPDFPTVQILEATPRRVVTRGELETAGLVVVPAPIPPIRRDGPRRSWGVRAWPSYERCLQNAPPAHRSAGRMSAAPISHSAYWRSIGGGDWRRPASVCLRRAVKPVPTASVTPGSQPSAPPRQWRDDFGGFQPGTDLGSNCR